MNGRRALALFAAIFVAYAYFFIPNVGSNVTARLAMIYSIVDHGTLNIDNYFHQTHDRSYYEGHWYSDKAPGSSFIGVPVYLVTSAVTRLLGLSPEQETFHYLIRLLTLSLLSALMGLALYRLCAEMTGDERAARLAVAPYALATPAVIYSVAYYSHQFAALFLLFGFYFLWRAKQGEGNLVWVGALLAGQAMFFEYPAGMGAGWLILYLLTFRRDWKSVAAFVVFAFVVPIGMHAAYNTAVFGGPASLGYSNLSYDVYQEEMSRGFMGIYLPRLSALWEITFSVHRGLFFYSPVLLIGLAGLRHFRSSALRWEGLLLAAMIGGFLLFNAAYFEPDGGSCFGPRHIVPMLPFMIPPLAMLLARAGSALRDAVFFLIVLSLAIATVAMFTYPLPTTVIGNPLYEAMLPLLADGYFVDTLAGWLGLGAAGQIVVYVLILLAAFGPALTGEEKPARSKRWAHAASIAAIFFIGWAYALSLPHVSRSGPGLVQQALGYEAALRHDFPRAAWNFEQALLARPDDPHLHYYLGDAYLKMNRPVDALVHLRRVLALAPDYPQAESIRHAVEVLEKAAPPNP